MHLIPEKKKRKAVFPLTALFLAVLFVLAISLFGSYAQAQDNPSRPFSSYKPLTITKNTGFHPKILPYLHTLKESRQKNNYLQALLNFTQGTTEKGDNKSGLIRMTGQQSSIWLFLPIDNKADQRTYMLSFGDIFDGRNGSIKSLRVYEHFKSRQLYDIHSNSHQKIIAFPLTVEPGQSLYVIEIERGPGPPLTFVPELQTIESFGTETIFTNSTDLYTVIMVGCMLALFLCGLFMQQPAPLILMMVPGFFLSSFHLQIDTVYSAGTASFLVPEFFNLGAGVVGLVATFFMFWHQGLPRAPLYFFSACAGLTIAGILVGGLMFSEQFAMHPMIFISAFPLLITFVVVSILSFMYMERASLFYFLGWAILASGIIIKILAETKAEFARPEMISAFWFSTAALSFMLVVTIFVREKVFSLNVLSGDGFRNNKTMRMLVRTRDRAEYERLTRVLERERSIMEELRRREQQKTEEMSRAKQQADIANRAKSAFLAMISHEIRTPMTGVMGMVRLLQDSALDEEQRDYVHTMDQSGKAMLTLLNDILDFEKIESGKMEIEHIDYNLHDVAQTIEALMKGPASEKNLKLSLDIQSDTPVWVKGDPMRLRQVLLNLISNAIKFTSTGEIHLTLKAKDKADLPVNSGGIVARCPVEIKVKDSGIGISPEAQKNLFSPFIQADKSIARRYGGSGLGLAICKSLIEAMKGTISVASVEGQGSVFTIDIPFELGKPQENAQAHTTHKNKGSYGSYNILIVEDNAINRKVMAGLLKKGQHALTFAVSAEEALDILDRQSDFDLIFMDIELPGINGDEAARRIRAHRNIHLRTIPIYALSGNVMTENARAYEAAGMNGLVHKPVIPEELDKVFYRLMRDKSGHAADGTSSPVHVQRENVSEMSAGASAGLRSSGHNEDILITRDSLSEPDMKLCDLDILEMLLHTIGREKLVDLVQELADKTEELTHALANEVPANDFETIRARAHELKGMAGNFGLNNLSGAVSELEKAGKNKDENFIRTHRAELLPLSKDSIAAVWHWLQQQPAEEKKTSA